MKNLITVLAVVFALMGFLSIPQASQAGEGGNGGCEIISAMCTGGNGDRKCVESAERVVHLLACQGVNGDVCYKQVVPLQSNTGGRPCVNCEEECSGEDSDKRDRCNEKCEKNNDDCDEGIRSRAWREIGEMSCVRGGDLRPPCDW